MSKSVEAFVGPAKLTLVVVDKYLAYTWVAAHSIIKEDNCETLWLSYRKHVLEDALLEHTIGLESLLTWVWGRAIFTSTSEVPNTSDTFDMIKEQILSTVYTANSAGLHHRD